MRMKKKCTAALLSAVMLLSTGTVMPVQAESIPPLAQPEDGFVERLKPYTGANTVYLQGDSSFADSTVVTSLPELSGNTTMLYSAKLTPNYDYAVQNNNRFALSEVYVADQLGSTITATLGDRYGADFSAAAIQAVAERCFDDSYTVIITENTNLNRITCEIRDPQCRAEMRALGQAFYEALSEAYTIYNCDYSQTTLRFHEIFCAGAFYSLEQYPNAKAELETFAETYAPEWYVAEYDGFVQLIPTDHTVNDLGNLAMARTVYEQLGYEMYVEYKGSAYSYRCTISDTQMSFISENVDFLALNALTPADYTLWQGDDAFLIRPEGAATQPLYVTDAYIGIGTINLQAPLYDAANLLAVVPSYHVISNGCMTANDPNETESETLAKVDAIVRSIFDDTYEIENMVAAISPICNHLVIRDPLMRDDIAEMAYQLCVALSEEFDFSGMVCREGSYSGYALQPSLETCMSGSFASYRYTAFPDAAEALTTFAETYAPDWYVREVKEKNTSGEWVPAGAYLCPKDADALRPYGTLAQQLDMAQLVYETLGYRVAATTSGNYPNLAEASHDIAATVKKDYAGDADMNGKVDTADAITVLQAYADTQLLGNDDALTTLRRQLADMDGDGVITTADAIGILAQYAESLT